MVTGAREVSAGKCGRGEKDSCPCQCLTVVVIFKIMHQLAQGGSFKCIWWLTSHGPDGLMGRRLDTRGRQSESRTVGSSPCSGSQAIFAASTTGTLTNGIHLKPHWTFALTRPFIIPTAHRSRTSRARPSYGTIRPVTPVEVRMVPSHVAFRACTNNLT